jgi:hypothetical protein
MDLKAEAEVKSRGCLAEGGGQGAMEEGEGSPGFQPFTEWEDREGDKMLESFFIVLPCSSHAHLRVPSTTSELQTE